MTREQLAEDMKRLHRQLDPSLASGHVDMNLTDVVKATGVSSDVLRATRGAVVREMPLGTSYEILDHRFGDVVRFHRRAT